MVKNRFEKPFASMNIIEVSRSAILDNYDLLQSIDDKQVIPVLKANAYGHGIEQVAEILKERPSPYIAVDGFHEALAVRQASKDQPVLVMGAIDPANFNDMNLNSTALVVYTLESIRALAELKHEVLVHIEVDTGMRRNGVRPEGVADLLDAIGNSSNIVLDGLMTHLADADNPEDLGYTKEQIEEFDRVVELVRERGHNPKYIHAGQSAGSTVDSSRYTNTIRPGISLYGISSLSPKRTQESALRDLQPALRLTSRVGAIQHIKKGETVSYSRTFEAQQDMALATLPFGYHEGFPRALSNKGIRYGEGDRFEMVGRICMNHSMVDITGADVQLGDSVELISRDKNSQHCIQALANRLDGVINYELMVMLDASIRRVITD